MEAARADERTPLSNVLAGERHKGVRDGLARLPKLDRQTLEAFYVKGRSLKQMSGDFKAPVGTIKRRLARGPAAAGQGSGSLDGRLNGADQASKKAADLLEQVGGVFVRRSRLQRITASCRNPSAPVLPLPG